MFLIKSITAGGCWYIAESDEGTITQTNLKKEAKRYTKEDAQRLLDWIGQTTLGNHTFTIEVDE